MSNIEALILDAVNKTKNERVIFEAFGTPGAGKSYFCNQLKNKISEKNSSLEFHFIDNYHQNRLLRLASKLIVILRSSWHRSDIYTLAFKFVSEFDDLTFLTRIKLIFNFMLVFSVVSLSSKKDRLILLDQGLFQGLWSCFFAKNILITANKLNILKSLTFKLIDAFDIELLVVIYVSASKEKVINGLQTRKIKGSSKLNTLNITEIEKGIRTTLFMLDFINDIVATHPKVKLIEAPR